jgi:xylan 1,4-beta-xylosidase
MQARPVLQSLALAAAVLCGSSAANGDDLPPRKLSIDATLTVGMLRPLSGVQAADAEGAPFYRAAHIDLVRIHDLQGAGDIDAIFPDFSADADNPKSYNFAPTDRVISSIKSAGAEPLFCIGRSSAAGPTPPADLEKWAQIVRHIVLHYNAGWGRGFRFGIRYWEIWNAPDSKLSWSGTPEEYYALYEKTANAVQAADADALVGGPALSKPLIAGAYREKFIDFVRLHRLPLNFFSWHFYSVDSNDPYLFVSIARQLRIILDTRGFGSARNVVDEWNVDPADQDMPQAARAAFAASALIYMLGGPIDAQTYHRADAAVREPGGALNAVGSALSAFGALKNTPILIRTAGGDDAGFAVVAGRSKGQRLIQILISNYQIAPQFLSPRDNWDTALPERRQLQYQDNGGYDATIELPTPGKYLVKRYRVNESANLTLLDQSVQLGPSIQLQASLPPPAIELIVISAK